MEDTKRIWEWAQAVEGGSYAYLWPTTLYDNKGAGVKQPGLVCLIEEERLWCHGPFGAPAIHRVDARGWTQCFSTCPMQDRGCPCTHNDYKVSKFSFISSVYLVKALLVDENIFPIN